MVEEKRYWFKPKIYGYGFCPISWEGWLFTLLLLALVFTSAYINNLYMPEVTDKDVLRFVLDIIIIATIFSMISVHRTKGDLKWRWGKKD